MSSPPRILISGWYGNGNLGDEALLAGMLDAIQAALPGGRVTVLSDEPGRTASEHEVKARGRDNRSHRRRLLSEAGAIARSDVLAIGGGGLVKDFGSTPGNVHAWVRPGEAARILRRPSMWYAIGVDEIRFKASADAARRAARRVDVLTVRDEGSARLLANAGVDRDPLVTADPALLLSSPENGRRRGLVAVCPRQWKPATDEVPDPGLQERLHSELAVALDLLVEEEDARVLLVPFRSVPEDDDAAVCRAILERMRRREAASLLDVPSSPREAAALLSGCDLVVGTRLHSLILAAAAATPFRALDYMPKVRFFAERVGLADRLSDLETAREPGRLAELLLADLRQHDGLADRLRVTVPPLQRLARLNAELLAALVRDRSRLPELAETVRGVDGSVRAAA